MRKIVLTLLLVINITIFAEEAFVEIYKTHDNGLYGRSEDRDIILSAKESTFKRYKSLDVKSEFNFLTAVVLNAEIIQKLETKLMNKENIQLGFVKISKTNNIYTVEDDNLFLSFSFSVEKPSQKVLQIIEDQYINYPQIQYNVLEHYNNNYIIRVHQAENMLFPEAQEITYDEALIIATIIGDTDQWLWGIHDGRDYLRDLLF